MNTKFNYPRITFYIIGSVLLAAGITLSTKTGLGVSPIISVPFSIAGIWQINFAVTTLVVYCILVGIQFLLKAPHYALADLLQIPYTVVFSLLLNFFDIVFTVNTSSLWLNLLLLAVAIIFIGIGAAMMVNMKLIPNPADGLAYTVGAVSHKGMGFGKNLIDFISVALSCILGLVFAGNLMGIGIGTVIAMIGVGRVIALFNRLFQEKLLEICRL